MTIDAGWLASALEARLPITSPTATLSLVAWTGAAGFDASKTGLSGDGLWACFELTKSGSTSTSIAYLVSADQLAHATTRVEAYLDGWARVVRRVLAEAHPNVVSNLISAQLVSPKVLSLARSKTADEFEKALAAPSRLGKLLGDPLVAMRSTDSGRS